MAHDPLSTRIPFFSLFFPTDMWAHGYVTHDITITNLCPQSLRGDRRRADFSLN
jgi:hypothetical protein